MKQRLRAMNEWVFERKFETVVNKDGSTNWEHSELPKNLDVHYIWSWVDGDSGEHTYLIPGMHVVNMIGYVITKKPWTEKDVDENLYVLWS